MIKLTGISGLFKVEWMSDWKKRYTAKDVLAQKYLWDSERAHVLGVATGLGKDLGTEKEDMVALLIED